MQTKLRSRRIAVLFIVALVALAGATIAYDLLDSCSPECTSGRGPQLYHKSGGSPVE